MLVIYCELGVYGKSRCVWCIVFADIYGCKGDLDIYVLCVHLCTVCTLGV